MSFRDRWAGYGVAVEAVGIEPGMGTDCHGPDMKTPLSCHSRGSGNPSPLVETPCGCPWIPARGPE